LQPLADITNVDYVLSSNDIDPVFTFDKSMTMGKFAPVLYDTDCKCLHVTHTRGACGRRRCYYPDGQPKTADNLVVLEGRHRHAALALLLREADNNDKHTYASMEVMVLENLVTGDLPLIAERKCASRPRFTS
jgi:hypothetical protein